MDSESRLRDIVGLAVVLMLALSMALNGLNLVVIARQSHDERQAVAVISEQAREGANAHKANCAFLAGQKAQIKSSADYLAKHPQGASSLGISAAVIRRGIAKEQSVVDSLRGLNC